MSTTKKLTTCALLIALATVLMWVSKLIPAPWLQGGSITIASMVPIVIAGILFGTKWGLSASIAYAIIQMLFGFYPPPTQTFGYFVLVVLLDYVIAFGVLGLSGFFYKLFGKKGWAIPVSAAIVTTLRYVCHILSGILIWGVYAEAGQSVFEYSLIYNGTYMIPEIIITTVVTALIFKMGFFKNQISKN
ncbi:MAG: energy-coupled thiamine transporter ThiT [Clostridia bacterium]|nr:energy-coupled thiamine transporter ThiT [Clostridia bacterium]